MYYRIDETLTQTTLEECLENRDHSYVSVLNSQQWKEAQERFGMEIDLALNTEDPNVTKAEVNIDSLTGSFCIPDQHHIGENYFCFSFALDENGIVFIDDTDYVEKKLCEISQSRKWKFPSLERFLYDFLEEIVENDLEIYDRFEAQLYKIENDIIDDKAEDVLENITEIRRCLFVMHGHYEQLIDLGQELAENENGFFKEENLRYFDMLVARVARLEDNVANLKDYSSQVRELYQSELSEKTNKTMNMLTIVTVIFTPLTFIAGWYGMNFRYMPELNWPLGYLLVFIVCALIAVLLVYFFKKKKWL